MSNLDVAADRAREQVRGESIRRWMLVVWPAFLAACLLEALVFAVVDPGEVHWPGQMPQPSRKGVYTIAFFAFWAVSMASTSLVVWLSKPARD